MVPRILVVLSLPAEEVNWINVGAEKLIMRRCALWTSLAGLDETKNANSVTISLREDNRFDIEALTTLMEQVKNGAIT